MQAINAALIDTIAACGDVNRNVMASANPVESRAHPVVYEWAKRLSEHLLPTHARVPRDLARRREGRRHATEVEPIYGATYLPRKFKTAIVVPPLNDVDVFANDLGFIAIIENGELQGFNLTVGGGMGATHGEPETYPAHRRRGRLPASPSRCSRSPRPSSRRSAISATARAASMRGSSTRSTHRGLDWFVAEITRRLGFALEPARPFEFTTNGDRFGWIEGFDGRWHLTLRIEAGRVADNAQGPLLDGTARDREGASRRLPAHAEPEPRSSRTSMPAERAFIDALVVRYGLDLHDARDAVASRRARLRRAADLRARDGRGRALPAAASSSWSRSGSRSTGCASEPLLLRITGLPERLRAAVPRRDRR